LLFPFLCFLLLSYHFSFLFPSYSFSPFSSTPQYCSLFFLTSSFLYLSYTLLRFLLAFILSYVFFSLLISLIFRCQSVPAVTDVRPGPGF
jgi:hypothetical protein